MATDAYGLSDFSMLSAPQQETARNINEAFTASMAARDRNLQRYAMAAPSAPMMAELANESALKQAQFSANILNQNQQLQNLIDASHATPHGFAQNLAAYLPMLGGVARAYPLLFGSDTSLSKYGIVGAAQRGLQSAGNAVHNFFNPADGQSYQMAADGSILPSTTGNFATSGADWASQVASPSITPMITDMGTSAAGSFAAPVVSDFGQGATNVASDVIGAL